MVLQFSGVQAVEVNMAAKTMRISVEGIDAEDIEEALEGIGIFV